VPEGSSTAKGKDDPTIRNELKALLDDKYGPSIREYVYRCVYKPSHMNHDRYFRDVSIRGDCFKMTQRRRSDGPFSESRRVFDL
jgi:hypothetical protein